MNKLDELNQQIKFLQQERKTWLEENFRLFAKFNEGDKIYAEVASNKYRMQPAGVVTKVYAKHTLESESPTVYYEFEKDPSYPYGNNTEGGWAYYYTHADWVRRQQLEIDRIKRTIQ